MRAMVLGEPGPVEERDRLELRDLAVPEPGADDVLVRVLANAVCLTDLHIVEGELAQPKPDLVPGHQIVGVVEARGEEVADIREGDRIGVPWLGGVCGRCPYCIAGLENLCDAPTFTGYTRDGGYAEYAVARAAFTFPLPEAFDDVDAAPLLCAGLIGYRSLRLAAPLALTGPPRIGFYGFGNAARIVTQVATREGLEVYACARGKEARSAALALGAVWAGGADQRPPAQLDAAIVYAPVGEFVPRALEAVRKGGTVVCAGIHMSPIPQFEYELLWGERVLRSVANLTRADGREFLPLAASVPVRTATQTFPLEQANEALRLHKAGALAGTAVLVP